MRWMHVFQCCCFGARVHCPGLTRGSFAASGGLHRAPLLAGPVGARYTEISSAWPTILGVTRFDEWVAPAYLTGYSYAAMGGHGVVGVVL